MAKVKWIPEGRKPSPDYKCPECKREFKTPQGLLGHKRMVHGIQKDPKPDTEQLVRHLQESINGLGDTMDMHAEGLGDKLDAIVKNLKESIKGFAYITASIQMLDRTIQKLGGNKTT